MESIRDRADRLYKEVGDYLYSDLDRDITPEVGRLWDFYDLFPKWFNKILKGEVPLSMILEDVEKVVANDLDDIEDILGRLKDG